MSRPTPSLITGTSSEYLGRRPTRRVLRNRYVVGIVGVPGAGKTSVAMRLARELGGEPMYLDTHALGERLADRVRNQVWADAILETDALVLDGPTWLKDRPGVVELLVELLTARADRERRTVVCDVNNDGSVDALMAGVAPGSAVVLGLRLPSSRSGRMRFARRCCDVLGIPRSAARGTDQIEPWGYEHVINELRAAKSAIERIELTRDRLISAVTPVPGHDDGTKQLLADAGIPAFHAVLSQARDL